jgi:hypothetical protein
VLLLFLLLLLPLLLLPPFLSLSKSPHSPHFLLLIIDPNLFCHFFRFYLNVKWILAYKFMDIIWKRHHITNLMGHDLVIIVMWNLFFIGSYGINMDVIHLLVLFGHWCHRIV